MDDQLKLIIIDDEAIVLKRLRQALEKDGFEVETFEDGSSALKRINEKHFDIVVTDVRMPGLNGIQVLEEIMSRSKQTKVILITGYATIEMAREAMAKGAFDCIAKPFKPSDLREIVNRAIKELKGK